MPSVAQVGRSRSFRQSTGQAIRPASSMIPAKQYAIQLAQLLLCGTSGWALNRTPYDPIASVAFTCLLGHSLLGLLKLTMKNENKKYIVKLYNYSIFISVILPLPLINTQIYYNYGYYDINTYSHAISGLIPIVFNALNKEWNIKSQADSKTSIVKLINFSNISSLSFIGILKDNYWALGLSWVSVINALALDFLEERNSSFNADYIVVALSFFNIFAVNALKVSR